MKLELQQQQKRKKIKDILEQFPLKAKIPFTHDNTFYDDCRNACFYLQFVDWVHALNSFMAVDQQIEWEKKLAAGSKMEQLFVSEMFLSRKTFFDPFFVSF